MKKYIVFLFVLQINRTHCSEPSYSTRHEVKELQVEDLEYTPSQKTNRITSLIFMSAMAVLLYDSCEISKDGVLFVPFSGIFKFMGRVCNGTGTLIRSLGKL